MNYLNGKYAYPDAFKKMSNGNINFYDYKTTSPSKTKAVFFSDRYYPNYGTNIKWHFITTDKLVKKYLDLFKKDAPKLCTCETQMLMRSGCQCGGS